MDRQNQGGATMSQSTKVDPGRVDHLAHGLFKKLLKTANPHVRPLIEFGCKILEPEIREVFEEEFGPGTKVDRIGRRIIRAMEDKS
jgi:hypothetical protein